MYRLKKIPLLAAFKFCIFILIAKPPVKVKIRNYVFHPVHVSGPYSIQTNVQISYWKVSWKIPIMNVTKHVQNFSNIHLFYTILHTWKKGSCNSRKRGGGGLRFQVWISNRKGELTSYRAGRVSDPIHFMPIRIQGFEIYMCGSGPRVVFLQWHNKI